MARLWIYGDIAMDICAQGSLPALGTDANLQSLALIPGGSASNCAAVAAKLGVEVHLIGALGSDPLADMLKNDLLSHGVNLDSVKRLNGQSGTVVVVTEPNGERTLLTFRGINAALRSDQLPAIPFEPGDWLHLTGYSFQDPDSRGCALALMDAASKAGTSISLDPSYFFARDFATPEILTRCDCLFPNEVEAKIMGSSASIDQAAENLIRMGCQQVIITLGGAGAYLASSHERAHIAPYPAMVVDSVGAGDAFAAGWLAGRLYGFSPVQACHLGHAAAAAVIEKVGAHTGAPVISDMAYSILARDSELGTKLLRIAAH